ncbi:MAG TPA: CHASE domain-containing protein [Thermoanaerobaculia bacterium]|nr:CHASE domain-containing protein [Thermoanaerobaculia bacterium]
MTSDGRTGSWSSAPTGRFAVRRVRSAFASWRASIRPSDILLASILVLLSAGLGAFLLARAHAAASLEYAQRAQRLHAAVVERLSNPLEDLATLSSFFEASGRVTRRQFHMLTDPMLSRHRLVYALEWLPFVHDRERMFQEAEARAAGLSTFRIWETGPDGKPVAAARREFYAPIQYMEPPNVLALGLDIASDPVRWSYAEKARDSGMMVASQPFVLIEDQGRPDPSPSIALYAPVYDDGDPGSETARRASLSGFAMAVIRVAPLVDAAAAAVDATGLAFVLRDGDAGNSAILVERPRGAKGVPRRSGFDAGFPVPVADRRWTLDIFALPKGFLPASRGPIAVVLAGALTALLGFVTLTSLRTISRLRRQAEKVGPYRLVARLGHGAMGVVWEARHALLRRPTAVKLLAPGTEGERALARFEREVQLTAGLTHPSTIAIYDYGRTADGIFYYAMELLRGINLLQLVNFDGPLPPARVVHLLRQACGALAEAHAAGLIHRDIKPANLMICVYGGIPDFLKILDFGLVKDIGSVEHPAAGEGDGAGAGAPDDASLSHDGSLLGTPLYMAPEGMSDSSKVDARADIFALGAVGYFLLTGGSPFPGRTAIEVFRMERRGPPPPLATAARHPVPPGLEAILRRCLAFDREERPVSAEELDALLSDCGAPPWKLEESRAWWRDRGPKALDTARGEREEEGRIMFLSAGDRARTV